MPVEKIIEVPRDVVVDVPIERTITTKKIINTIKEKPIEKIVEIPIY